MSREGRIESERCHARLRNGERCSFSGHAIPLADGTVIYLCGNHTGAARERFDGYSDRMRGVA